MSKKSAKSFFYPEILAGGFSHADGTIEFYSRIRSLIRDGHTVVDYGAGRGQGTVDDPVPYRKQLRNLLDEKWRVVGVDIDSAVFENIGVNSALLIQADGSIPLDSESVDVIVSDSTFEHIDNPEVSTSEIKRILKPGGWLCARTPNFWGYISLGANLIPNSLHAAILKYLQPDRKEIDIFPTKYELNTKKKLNKFFPRDEYEHCSYYINGEPAYFSNSILGWTLVKVMFRLLPPFMKSTMLIFIRKKPASVIHEGN